jgi:hypothetical protein
MLATVAKQTIERIIHMLDDETATERAPRKINPNSLLGLLWRLRANADGLDDRIKGLEKKLCEYGLSNLPRTCRDIAALLQQRRASGHNRFLA